MTEPRLILLGYASIAIGLGWTCGVIFRLVSHFLAAVL